MRSTRWPARAEMVAMSSVAGLTRSGGVQRWETEAANEAIRATRLAWLPVLERWQADWHERARRKPTAAGLRDGVFSPARSRGCGAAWRFVRHRPRSASRPACCAALPRPVATATGSPRPDDRVPAADGRFPIGRVGGGDPQRCAASCCTASPRADAA